MYVYRPVWTASAQEILYNGDKEAGRDLRRMALMVDIEMVIDAEMIRTAPCKFENFLSSLCFHM